MKLVAAMKSERKQQPSTCTCMLLGMSTTNLGLAHCSYPGIQKELIWREECLLDRFLHQTTPTMTTATARMTTTSSTITMPAIAPSLSTGTEPGNSLVGAVVGPADRWVGLHGVSILEHGSHGTSEESISTEMYWTTTPFSSNYALCWTLSQAVNYVWEYCHSVVHIAHLLCQILQKNDILHTFIHVLT